MELFPSYLSLAELNAQVKKMLRPLSVQKFWIVAEISQINFSNRGHVYLELVEKDNKQIIAKIQAVIWYSQMQAIRSKLGNDTNLLLKSGNKVLFKASLDFHPVYSLKLNITDVDPSVTLGDLEKRRLETIAKLQEEGMIGRNAQLPMAKILQRVAVISSQTAAGFGDFMNQLGANPYGYRFQCTLFNTAMQGDHVEKELIAQLNVIAKYKNDYDAVIIIRGGGSKLDLEAFNNYKIAKAIAQCPLPVLTGIGHQQDETVADLVAYTKIKTPTAVAEYLIMNLAQFEYELKTLFDNLHHHAFETIQDNRLTLQSYTESLRYATRRQLQNQEHQISKAQQFVKQVVPLQLQQQKLQLQYLARTFDLLDVHKLLKRGFSITRKNGEVVQDIATLKKGDVLSTQLAEGVVKSEIV